MYTYIIQIIYPRETFLVQIIGLSHSNNLRGGMDCLAVTPTVTASYAKDSLPALPVGSTIHWPSIWLHKQAWLRGVLDVGVQILY